MSSFHLQIVTPDGLFYDGQAESLNLRAAQGGLTILPRHTNFVTTVGMGPVHGSGPFFITECASTARKLFTLCAKNSHWLSDRNFFGRQSRRIK